MISWHRPRVRSWSNHRLSGVATDLAIALFFVLLIGKASIGRGPDASWDLRNYHLYLPYALFNGRASIDLFPATIVGFVNPLVDIPSYLLRIAFNQRPNTLSFLLSLPFSAGAFLAYRIALSILPADITWRRAAAFMAALIGLTGIGAYSTIGSSEGEALPAFFTLLGLLLTMSAISTTRLQWYRWGAAGVCCGIAVGLKLTEASYAVGLFAGITLFADALWRNRACAALAYVGGGIIGAALSGGWWWTAMLIKFGNPFFPFYNNIFHSPWFPPIRLGADYLHPSTLLQTLFYPFYWALSVQELTWEAPSREPRFAIAYVAVVVAVAAMLLRRDFDGRATPAARRSRLFLVFLVTSYALWQQLFSVYRYLYPLEVTIALPLLIAAMHLQRTRSALPATAALAAALVLCLSTSVYVNTQHARPAHVAAFVDMPELPPGAMVILLDSSPMAFVAAFARPDIRFMGANNALISLDRPSKVGDLVAKSISGQTDGLWGIASLKEWPDGASQAMAHYRLECTEPFKVLRSNLSREAISICPLQHVVGSE